MKLHLLIPEEKTLNKGFHRYVHALHLLPHPPKKKKKWQKAT